MGPVAGLTRSTSGEFYGTTVDGGAKGFGTVFKITRAGTLTTLHSFDSNDGAQPVTRLIQATDGNFYGTTPVGGGATVSGVVFKMTPAGALTTLHLFAGTDGAAPESRLIQATDWNLYGTTQLGGLNGLGTIFRIATSGTFTTLHHFDSTEGYEPIASLMQATNGGFYGTAAFGGASGDGTVFSFSVGLNPFVKTLPSAGKVGAAVKILGTDLTGATSVTFNGAAAAFTVVSASEITTTVPAGATTGTVEVVTPSGALSSNVPFRVLP